jgi:hypothetical protein
VSPDSRRDSPTNDPVSNDSVHVNARPLRHDDGYNGTLCNPPFVGCALPDYQENFIDALVSIRTRPFTLKDFKARARDCIQSGRVTLSWQSAAA